MDEQPRTDETSRLVAIGRDRDAADLYARSRPEPRLENPVDSIEQLDEILPALTGVARNIRPDQLANPTACSEFTVRDVLDHMVAGAGFFAAQFRGDAPPDGPPANVPDVDLTATFTAAMEALDDAVKQPGALERTVASPFGDVPGDVVARFLALDGMVHTWDLATATGQTYTPSVPVVDEVLAFAHQAIAPEMRGGAFALEVECTPDATPLEQLVAFTGRTA